MAAEDSGRELVVVTGARGRVAAMVAPRLRAAFQLRGIDLVAPAESEDEFVRANVRDVDAVAAALLGAVAVLHLAAQPAEAEFRETLLPQNLDATWAVYEAAVRAGVPRFIFASTVQTVDGYPAGATIAPGDPPRPVSVYGCTKVFGEALGRFHSDSSGLGVACLRLGAVHPQDADAAADPRLRDVWLGADDLADLIVAAVRSDIQFATVNALSVPATARFNTINPFGWAPRGLR